jgi:phospholipid/cholesterol/gamma-HCH transport system substrate-binding protein
MKIPYAAMPRIRATVVIAFIAVCTLLFGYLWTNMGGTIPGISSKGYRISVDLPDADNLVYDSDVMIAGVRVGKVRKLQTSGGVAHVVMQLDTDNVVPLHRGTTVQVRSKSLVEETYLEITDGTGAALPDDAKLPKKAVRSSVQLDQVLKSLDAPTRASIRKMVRSLGAGTTMTQADISRTLTGLGELGSQGHDVLDALAAQSEDLRSLVRESQTMVDALDTGRGQIVDLVNGAERLTSATAANKQDLQATVTRLPGLMANADRATRSLKSLATSLTPVTANLRAASVPLNKALEQLPATTRDLRGLMPALNSTLDKSPTTLKALPKTADTLDAVLPTLSLDMADLNPMLGFLKPYGRDLAAFFTTWTAMLQQSDVNGHYLRIFPVVNEGSFKGLPIPLNYGILDKSNAYPAPGESTHPGPYNGTYPRVQRAPQ